MELLHSLNCSGHTVSYSQIEENDTAWCLQELENLVEGHVKLPDIYFPYVMAPLAWDYIDMLEKTLTGGGTSHRINGIIVQPRVYCPTPQVKNPVEQPVLKKEKKRSIFIDDHYAPIYNSGARDGPEKIVMNVQ